MQSDHSGAQNVLNAGQIAWHTQDRTLFQEAIGFTATQTGFLPRLIEKDYFCSVLLHILSTNANELVFKGGTCLCKVHAGFCRLSEDLDFCISTPTDSSRTARRNSMAPLKTLLERVASQVPGFQVVEALEGFNHSTHYQALLQYTSHISSQPETIRIEISLREPIINDAYVGNARTALLNPLRGSELVAPFAVRCLSWKEAMAEKFRAALCRKDVAIRDFFDVDFAVLQAGLQIDDLEFIQVIIGKLQVHGTGAVDMSINRLNELTRQLNTQLRPVLRNSDYEHFDLERAIQIVRTMAERCSRDM